MGNSKEYRHLAGSCMRLAEQIRDSKEKATLLEMARAWHNLADQGERNSKTDLVYETQPRALRGRR
jgi:hypothetical protein